MTLADGAGRLPFFRLAAGVALAAVLGFGATSALARPLACAAPGIGSCGTRGECLRMCAEAEPDRELLDGQCSGGCCTCVFGTE